MATKPSEYAAQVRGGYNSRGPREWVRSDDGVLKVWPYRIIRMCLAAVFLWSGITKLVAPNSFVVIIDSYGLIPKSWNLPAAVFLASLEALVGVGLGLDIRGSLVIVAALLCLFMVILGYGSWLGLDIDCGCFGPEDPEAEAYHGLRPALWRDFLMILGVVYLYAWRHLRSVKPVSLLPWIRKNIKRRKEW